MTDLDEFAARLDRLAAAEYPFEIVEMLADRWVAVSQERAPVDTAFMKANIVVTNLEGGNTRASAEIESRANYSGFVNGGTRWMAPRPFFDDGMLAAEQDADPLNVKLSASVEALLDGGARNPLR